MKNQVVATTFLLLCAASIRSEEQCRNILRLSYDSVRNGVPSRTTPLPSSTGIPCNEEYIKVLCSDAGYPNDIICDVGRIRFHSSWENSTGIVEIQLTYKHPTAEGTYCKLSHTTGAEGTDVLAFAGAECTPDVEDDVMPTFRLPDIVHLTVKATTLNPGHSYHGDECFTNVYVFGNARNQGATKGGAKGARRIVMFDLVQFYCRSSTTTLIGGRMAEKAIFLYNGRRYRPGRTTNAYPSTSARSPANYH